LRVREHRALKGHWENAREQSAASIVTSALSGRIRLLAGTQGDASLCPGLIFPALSARKKGDNVHPKCSENRKGLRGGLGLRKIAP